MSSRWVPFAVLALLLAPGVLAHGGVEDEDRYAPNRPRLPDERPPPTIPEGYTGPGREPYLSYFEGVWLYGQMAATPVNGQHPADLDADGDWVVWEDTVRSDIYAFSISAGQGFYITNDRWVQHKPQVSENVVVFEDHRNLARPAIYAYFLDTGELRRLSNSTRTVRDPSIDWPIVAWLDENITNPDIWAYSLLNNTAWNVHPGTDRDADPVALRDRIFWRSYRYNLWDVMGYDVETGQEIQVTTDAPMQSSPFDNGEDLLFLSQYEELGWALDRFDLDTELVTRASFYIPDTGGTSASGDAVLRLARDIDYSQLVVRNLTSGATNHVSGNLLLTAPPIIHGRTIFAPVSTREGTSLLQLQVSPFAFAKRPSLTISSPATNTPWLRPLVVTGILQTGAEFTEPTTFTYRLDEQPPQIIPTAERWRFTLDPNGMEPGTHTVTIRATFREGPPVVQSIDLVIPAPSQGVDVARAGPAFHAARLMGELNAYVLDNPASWLLIPLVLLLFAIAGLRAWLWIKPRRRASIAEYVPPDAE